MTKRRDVIRVLTAYGFASADGAWHEKLVHPDGRQAVVPRHAEIKDLTFRLILKQAGITPRR